MKKKHLHEPMVSICLITYNHEKYIKQAVDSILNQQMDFTYEMLIADDASTDRTQQILLENYSDVENVRLILREKNSEGRNGYLTFQEANGKYIYYCEGDDYWIGTDGLQTLTDYLERHEEYIGVAGRRITLSEKTGLMTKTYDLNLNNKKITLDNYINNKWTFDFCALLFRNFYHDGKWDYRYYLASKKVGDLTQVLYVLLHGNVFQLDKIVGVYRADRIPSACAYNVMNTPKMIFEDHIDLILHLNGLIREKLDYSELKKLYTMWYADTFGSTYELLRQITYIQSKVGIKIALSCVMKRIKAIRG